MDSSAKKSNNYQKKLSNLKFIDLFVGIGGFRLALESFGEKALVVASLLWTWDYIR